MKRLILIIALIASITIVKSQEIEFSSFNLSENMPNWFVAESQNIIIGKNLLIEDILNPFYLEADFNGDGFIDIAIYVTEKETKKKGILIAHRNSPERFLLGGGEQFGKVDDFSWMEVWKVQRNPTAEETIFTDDYDIEGSRTVNLHHPAIEVAPSEGSSNLIVWNGKEYVWIHTGD